MENMEKIHQLIPAMSQIIVGNKLVMRRLLQSMLADLHLLTESPPGLAKTLLIETLQHLLINAKAARIQLTPDLKPGDIVGVKVYNPGTASFEDETGPIIGVNILLADEINRTTPKAQSALLSAMQERISIIGKNLYPLEDPFLVMATQNPVEQEGTYPLPEAQLDRFGMKIIIGYPTEEEEVSMLGNPKLEKRKPYADLPKVLSIEDIKAAREHLRTIYVSEAAKQYIVGLVQASRPGQPAFQKVVQRGASQSKLSELIKLGCSPRASQALMKLGRVEAWMNGRDYVLPSDIRALTKDVMRHRIMLTPDALAEYEQNGAAAADAAVSIILENVDVVQDPKLYKRPA